MTVDGGINIETIGEVIGVGAQECVVGSHLLQAKNIEEVYSRLEMVAKQSAAHVL
jgi:pentose-5-phosphate-3-epimerase